MQLVAHRVRSPGKGQQSIEQQALLAVFDDLRDHPRLAHPDCQQCLPQRIVNLVCARVIQVLAFEPDLGSPAMLRQSFGEVQRGRATHEVAEQGVQLRLKVRVCLGLGVFGFQLVQRRN